MGTRRVSLGVGPSSSTPCGLYTRIFETAANIAIVRVVVCMSLTLCVTQRSWMGVRLLLRAAGTQNPLARNHYYLLRHSLILFRRWTSTTENK